MTRSAFTLKPLGDDDDESWSRFAAVLTSSAMALLLILVLARATMQETLRDPFEVSLGSQTFPRGLSAAGSVVLDWLACIPALLVLVRRLFAPRGSTLRRSTAFLFLAALATWAAMSPIWSADRFVAVVGVSHFVAAFAIAWAAFQLVRTPRQLRLVIGACFGLLLVLVAHSLIYRFVEWPDTKRSVEQGWDQIIAARGWTPGSFLERQFHLKVMSGELFGFFNSPNSLAAVLVFLGIIAAGAMWQRIADRDQIGWPIVLAIALLLTGPIVFYTHSKTAFLTPILAAIALIIVATIGRQLSRHRGFFFVVSVFFVAIAAGLVVAYGLRYNALPSASLAFRWRYWLGAARLLHEHPKLGVGWNNFGDFYLGVRAASASEEIKDPHNLLVRIACELGAIGLTLTLGWLAMLAWAIVKPRESVIDSEAFHGRPDDANRSLKIVLLISAGAMLINSIASVDFGQEFGWVFIEVMKRFLFAALLCVGIIVVAFRSVERAVLDDRPAEKLRIAGGVAVLIFLLHNTIDFSFFESGPMWMFMLVLGSVMAGRTGYQAPPRRAAFAMVTLSSLLLWLALGLGLALPLLLAESKAADADEHLRNRQPAEASRLLLDAFDTLPFSNVDYLSRAAAAQIYAEQSPETIRKTMHRAIDADPHNPLAANRLADFERHHAAPDQLRIRDAYSKAIAIDPYNIQLYLDYGQTLEQLGYKTAAANNYIRAFGLNDMLEEHDPKRRPPEEMNRLYQHALELAK